MRVRVQHTYNGNNEIVCLRRTYLIIKLNYSLANGGEIKFD